MYLISWKYETLNIYHTKNVTHEIRIIVGVIDKLPLRNGNATEQKKKVERYNFKGHLRGPKKKVSTNSFYSFSRKRNSEDFFSICQMAIS